MRLVGGRTTAWGWSHAERGKPARARHAWLRAMVGDDCVGQVNRDLHCGLLIEIAAIQSFDNKEIFARTSRRLA